MDILWWLLIGLLAGVIARAIVPGSDPMGWGGTLILGLVGSLIGGFLFSMLLDGDGREGFSPAGLLGSIIGAVVALLIWRSMSSRSRTRI